MSEQYLLQQREVFFDKIQDYMKEILKKDPYNFDDSQLDKILQGIFTDFRKVAVETQKEVIDNLDKTPPQEMAKTFIQKFYKNYSINHQDSVMNLNNDEQDVQNSLEDSGMNTREKRIYTFKQFVNERKLTNEDFFLNLLLENKIVYSDKFKKILKKIKDPIAKDLLSLEGDDNKKTNINYIDVSDKDGQVTFSPDTKATSPEDILKYKKDIKLGKVVQKLATIKEKTYKGTEIEDFVSKYKANQKDNKDFQWEIVTGNEIHRYYQTENYVNVGNVTNELWKSCMNNKPKGFYELYEYNTKQISLLILKGIENKILGRALIWNAISEETNEKYQVMDRIYSVTPDIMYMFIDYATKNDMCYKEVNKSDVGTENLIIYNNENLEENLYVQLDKAKFKNYPFCDTFRYLELSENILYNNPDLYDDEDYEDFILMSDEGHPGVNFNFD
jgi:flagella basal body P-ring formation protein FlgA